MVLPDLTLEVGHVFVDWKEKVSFMLPCIDTMHYFYISISILATLFLPIPIDFSQDKGPHQWNLIKISNRSLKSRLFLRQNSKCIGRSSTDLRLDKYCSPVGQLYTHPFVFVFF